jgi:putative ABC transport system permease protein
VSTFRLALAGLKHRPLRSVLMVLSVSIAIAVLTLVLAVQDRLRSVDKLAGSNDQLIVNSLEARSLMPMRYVEELRHVEGDEVLFWSRTTFATDGARFVYKILGVSDGYPDEVASHSPTWFEFKPETVACWRQEPRAIIVGFGTADQLHWKVGDTVTLQTSEAGAIVAGGTLQAKVCGIATGLASSNVVAHYEYMDKLSSKPGFVDMIGLRVKSERMGDMIHTIDDRFANSDTPTRSLPAVALMMGAVNALSEVPVLLTRIGKVIVAVTALVTLNTLAMSMRERGPKLATLWALGYRRRRVLWLLLLESLLLCVAGGVIGAVLPFALFHTNGLTMGRWVLANITVSTMVCLSGLASAVVLGIVVALWPAVRTAGQLGPQALMTD